MEAGVMTDSVSSGSYPEQYDVHRNFNLVLIQVIVAYDFYNRTWKHQGPLFRGATSILLLWIRTEIPCVKSGFFCGFRE